MGIPDQTRQFKDHRFQLPKPEHEGIRQVSYERVAEQFPLDCGLYDWEYFGTNKYDRYAVCKNTGVKRSLTMGEFYGSLTVD